MTGTGLPFPIRRIPLLGGGDLPVNKILAVGRNYADHAAEMQAPAEPVFFQKPVTALRLPGQDVVLPRHRGPVHHEIEIVIRLAAGGTNLEVEEAARAVGAYGLALDLTLREVQARAKEKGRPWTLAKGFDGSMPVAPLVRVEGAAEVERARFRLLVDGSVRQEGSGERMLLSPAELVARLSSWITLEAGDLLLTGTPSGVGPVEPGQEAVLVLEGVYEHRVRFL